MKDKAIRFLSSTPVILLCRLILGGLFIYASIHKIAQPHEFAKIIYNYRLFPDFSIYIFAAVVPWLELAAGLFLIIGIFTRASAAVLSTLLFLFTIAISINLVRGLDFNCGCFTSAGGTSDPAWMIVRDILMLIPGLVVIFFYKERARRRSP